LKKTQTGREIELEQKDLIWNIIYDFCWYNIKLREKPWNWN
jgi:hypothetical protein